MRSSNMGDGHLHGDGCLLTSLGLYIYMCTMQLMPVGSLVWWLDVFVTLFARVSLVIIRPGPGT